MLVARLAFEGEAGPCMALAAASDARRAASCSDTRFCVSANARILVSQTIAPQFSSTRSGADERQAPTDDHRIVKTASVELAWRLSCNCRSSCAKRTLPRLPMAEPPVCSYFAVRPDSSSVTLGCAWCADEYRCATRLCTKCNGLVYAEDVWLQRYSLMMLPVQRSCARRRSTPWHLNTQGPAVRLREADCVLCKLLGGCLRVAAAARS